MHGVLLVQGVQRARHGGTQPGDLFDAGRRVDIHPMLQCLAGDVFHDQIRYARQVARSHKAWYVAALQYLHDLAFDFEADDVLGTVAGRHAGNLHGHGEAGVALAIGVVDAVDMGHAAGVNAFFDREAVQLGAGFEQFHRPSSSRSAKNSGRPARRIALAAANRS